MNELIFLSFLVMSLDVERDVYLIRQNKTIKHDVETLMEALIYVGAGLIWWRYFIPFSEVLFVWLMIPSSRWIWHDGFMNLRRGLRLDYVPKENPNISHMDRFLIWVETETRFSGFTLKWVFLGVSYLVAKIII